MAGRPISREYEARINAAGIDDVLERISYGENMGAVARGLGISRWFLSTFLNKDPYVAAALVLSRERAAYRQLASRPKREGGPKARKWVGDSSAAHFAALKAIRSEDFTKRGRSPAVTQFLTDLAAPDDAVPAAGEA